MLLLCNILSITKKISSSIIFFLNYLSGEREGGDKQQQQSCKTNVGCGIVCDRSVTHSQCRGFDALSGSLCLLNLFALRNLKKKIKPYMAGRKRALEIQSKHAQVRLQ